uniref:Uncharacterized protein n=1 Tax=Tetranychus urticae TaxID=32264 RepID=T1KX58_TETUR
MLVIHTQKHETPLKKHLSMLSFVPDLSVNLGPPPISSDLPCAGQIQVY